MRLFQLIILLTMYFVQKGAYGRKAGIMCCSTKMASNKEKRLDQRA